MNTINFKIGQRVRNQALGAGEIVASLFHDAWRVLLDSGTEVNIRGDALEPWGEPREEKIITPKPIQETAKPKQPLPEVKAAVALLSEPEKPKEKEVTVLTKLAAPQIIKDATGEPVDAREALSRLQGCLPIDGLSITWLDVHRGDVLAALEGRTVEGLADLLGIKISTIRNWLHRRQIHVGHLKGHGGGRRLPSAAKEDRRVKKALVEGEELRAFKEGREGVGAKTPQQPPNDNAKEGVDYWRGYAQAMERALVLLASGGNHFAGAS